MRNILPASRTSIKKKSEHLRIDASELWCWRRLLRVPWTARGSIQSILKEISHEYSLEGLMLKLKLQYFGHLIRRTDSFGKTLILGKIKGGRRRGRQRMKWLDGITDSWTWLWVNSGVGDGQGGLAWCSPWGRKEWDTTEWLTDWLIQLCEVNCQILKFQRQSRVTMELWKTLLEFWQRLTLQNQGNNHHQILPAVYNYFTDVYKLKIGNGGRKCVSFFLFQLGKRIENI